MSQLLAILLVLPASAQQICFVRSDHPTGVGPRWVAIDDLDDDGVLDLVVANGDADTLSVLLGTGGGTFGSPTTHTSGAGPRSVALGDMNGDGDLDAVVANEPVDEISVHAGDGLGAFAARGTLRVGASPRTVALADFDLDGALDCAVASHDAEEIAVAFGDGLGGFEATIELTAPGPVPHLSVADIDLDGDADIVGAQAPFAFAFRPIVLENEADRTFAEVGGSFMTGDPVWIALGDLDGDGLPDLIAPTDDSLDSLLEPAVNDGTNHFDSTVNFIGTAWRNEIGDFDGDGDADSVHKGIGPVSIALGNGDATFSFPSIQTSVVPTAHIAVADLDGNGLDDFVAAGGIAGGISVMLSQGIGFQGTSLSSCPVAVSVAAGVSQTYALDAGPGNAFGLYLLLTTTTGTAPGLPLSPSSLTLPLNFSNLLLFTVIQPNLLIPDSLGFLDANGKRTLALSLPPGLDSALASATLHHAYMVLELVNFTATYVSNAAPLRFTL